MMPYNTQKQIDYISKLILEDRIEGEDLRLWPIRVAKTLKEYTDNRIDLNLKSYCQRAQAKSQKAQAKRNEEIQELKNKTKLKRAKILELEKELRNLEKGIKQEQKEAAELKSENIKEKYLQEHFEASLKAKK